MAKYLKPRRGSMKNAVSQNIVLQKGELFLEFTNDGSSASDATIGCGPGRIIVGKGSTSYSNLQYTSTVTTDYRPFITDPSIYVPRFNNTTVPSSGWTINTASSILNDSSFDGSTAGMLLPTMIGKIKETLCLHDASITKLSNDLGGKLSTSGGTMTGTIYTPGDDGMGIIPKVNNFGQLGSSASKFFRAYIGTVYGNLSGNATSATCATTATNAGTATYATNSSTATYASSGPFAASNHNHDSVYVKADGSTTMTGNIKSRGSVFVTSGNGDYVSMDDSGNERWRIWHGDASTYNLAPNYRSSNNATAGSLFSGYLALAQSANTRIVYSITGNFATILKAGEIGFFVFMAGTTAAAGTGMAFAAGWNLGSSNCSWHKYICGNSKWTINYNSSGTVVAQYDSKNCIGIGIIVGQP